MVVAHITCEKFSGFCEITDQGPNSSFSPSRILWDGKMAGENWVQCVLW